MRQSKNLAGLNYIEAGDLLSPNKIIMFHGYGADMLDLYSLAGAIDSKNYFHWIFPNGILDVPIGPHMMGKAWFNIDIPAFERSIRLGEFTKQKPSGMDLAKDKAEKFLLALNCDFSHTIIGGFSQGAMLVTELLLETSIKPKGAILLSATLVNEDRWTSQMPNKKGLRYYQSHGSQDPILPVELAEMLHEKLEQSGWDGFLQVFQGGHEIPHKVIADIISFLR
jgi:phospholipase/carboxylesterase